MAKLQDVKFADFKTCKEQITQEARLSSSFEEAVQKYVTAIYENFKESMVLIRTFATIPFEKLPPENQQFVNQLAVSKNITQLINNDTLVLSLLGTAGSEAEWFDRKNSQGHVGIPLASSDFIDAIPMMSRLLKQLGLGLDWIDNKDTELVKKTIVERMSGLFFVPDATTEVDQQGRKIIAAQDFVNKYGVKTVFGYGDGYSGTQTFSVTIIFLREELTRERAEQFYATMNFFKSLTIWHVKNHFWA
ncbi:hypothetical protein JW964_27480 [candidate division KSB1 bacterium]|nr:hypothetical protein [candidate division KSB1 bacterium]